MSVSLLLSNQLKVIGDERSMEEFFYHFITSWKSSIRFVLEGEEVVFISSDEMNIVQLSIHFWGGECVERTFDLEEIFVEVDLRGRRDSLWGWVDQALRSTQKWQLRTLASRLPSPRSDYLSLWAQSREGELELVTLPFPPKLQRIGSLFRTALVPSESIVQTAQPPARWPASNPMIVWGRGSKTFVSLRAPLLKWDRGQGVVEEVRPLTYLRTGRGEWKKERFLVKEPLQDLHSYYWLLTASTQPALVVRSSSSMPPGLSRGAALVLRSLPDRDKRLRTVRDLLPCVGLFAGAQGRNWFSLYTGSALETVFRDGQGRWRAEAGVIDRFNQAIG